MRREIALARFAARHQRVARRGNGSALERRLGVRAVIQRDQPRGGKSRLRPRINRAHFAPALHCRSRNERSDQLTTG
jgi:hypothetical protein